MDVTISVPQEVVQKLTARAADEGSSFADYAAKLLTERAEQTQIDDLLEPVRQDFARSGMSEGEINDFLRGEIEAHRREKRERN